MDEIKEKALKKAKEEQEKNIVVVDDYMDFAQNIAEYLSRPGKSKCVAFVHPQSVLKHLASNNVDILVTGYEMPVMNGIELAKEVLEKYPNIRIIIMSGHDTNFLNQVIQKAEICGKVEVMCKSNTKYFDALI